MAPFRKQASMRNDEDIGEPWKKNSCLDETLEMTFHLAHVHFILHLFPAVLRTVLSVRRPCLLYASLSVVKPDVSDQRSKRPLKIMRQKKRLIGMSILSWHLETHDLCPCLVSSPCSIVLNSLFTSDAVFTVVPRPSYNFLKKFTFCSKLTVLNAELIKKQMIYFRSLF